METDLAVSSGEADKDWVKAVFGLRASATLVWLRLEYSLFEQSSFLNMASVMRD